MQLSTIEEALDALRAGKPILVADDENRENEGDAIIAAELAVGAKSGGGGSGGIGQMMFVFYAYNIDLNAIVVCMAVVGVVALLIDRLFRAAERHLIPWRQ